MKYQPSVLEKLFRGLMIGFIPPTILLFLYFGFFARGARGVDNESKAKVGELFFGDFQAIIIAWCVVYLVSAFFGFRYGWQGYLNFFIPLSNKIEYILEKFRLKTDDRSVREILDDPENITPAERVRLANERAKLHNK